MKPVSRTCVLAPFALVALCLGPAAADTIYLVDGSTLLEVEIETEELGGVTYKAKGKTGTQTLDADLVLEIEYRKLPNLLDQAEGLVREGALNDAIERYENFVEGVESGENRKDKQAWAPAHALRRVVELRVSLGDVDGVVKAADALIAKAPNSRHAPEALLAKSEALRSSDKVPAGRAVLEDLRSMIDAKALSNRWKLELELAEVLSNAELKGQAKRDRLIEIAGQAGKAYPGVANRARVAEGETWLEGAKPDYANARKVFEKILADPKADDATMAGAYTGMGDCLFHVAAGKAQAGEAAPADLEAALAAYMRVVVNYRDQTRYAPKAMFYAGRVFDLLGDENSLANARRIYGSVIQNYPGSNWAKEARSSRK